MNKSRYRNNSTANGHYLIPVPIENTEDFIEQHLQKISSVQRLATMMGYSRSYLSKQVKGIYGSTAGKLLRRIRYRKVHEHIADYPYETSSAIATRIGLKDDQALYKFLSRHYTTNFTEVRNKILNGNGMEPSLKRNIPP